MRFVAGAACSHAIAPLAVSLVAVSLFAAAGCAQNPYVLQGQLQNLQQQHLALNQKYLELQTRADTLDQDNQEHQTLLAQAQQQRKVLEDQLDAVRDQLGGATTQLARLRDERSATDKKVETLAASVKRKAGATITANNSLKEQLPAIDIPGVEVRHDGDVVRIELPGNQLFESGGARLLGPASSLIDSVASEIARAYPSQLIGVEGHTDNDPISNQMWRDNHHLSLGRAMAVYDYLATHSHLKPQQLFVVGHGANHPVVSNGTLAGKDRNRRVELVIYPEKMTGR
ncbi:MAG TPA: OmpA family protein [Pirellulales bacterium]|jgi:flagellar motor protein MotB|nr:OmpA family protein [Pirellulales bacterium]